MPESPTAALALADIEATAERLSAYLAPTPVTCWDGPELRRLTGDRVEVWVKLEPFQRSGTFKVRGALNNLLALDEAQRQRGVTAVSAGNHAIAVAYAARLLGISARVVMLRSANPARVKLARALGAELLIADDGASGFQMAEAIASDEGRFFVHPFDGLQTILGTATLGLEFHRQAGPFDALIVAIGGGGLAAGAAAATRLLNPDCRVFGVEPYGADSMHRSFASGQAEHIGTPDTIADSLAPPMTLPLPFALCRANIEEILRVSDAQICAAMGLVFRELKLAVEPAGAAASAVLQEVSERIGGGRIGVVCCGSNIDLDSFHRLASHAAD